MIYSSPFKLCFNLNFLLHINDLIFALNMKIEILFGPKLASLQL